jgi:catechol 2,3-dioxygenase-like lactoylglutathione lyase family enzyme
MVFRMITGLHAILYSPDADKVRAFLRDVLGLKSVDAGHGWLIFAAPPAELAAHPTEGNEGPRHELYLMCDDLKATMKELSGKGVQCSAITEARWGSITSIHLPGGGELGLYQPKHPTALGLR